MTPASLPHDYYSRGGSHMTTNAHQTGRLAKPDADAVMNLALDWKKAADHEGRNLNVLEWNALPENLKQAFVATCPEARVHHPLFGDFEDLMSLTRNFLMVQNVAREIVDAHIDVHVLGIDTPFTIAQEKLERRIRFAERHDVGVVTHDATHMIARMMEGADDTLRTVEKRRVASDILGAKADKKPVARGSARKFGFLSHK